jgi:hypothetical protein
MKTTEEIENDIRVARQQLRIAYDTTDQIYRYKLAARIQALLWVLGNEEEATRIPPEFFGVTTHEDAERINRRVPFRY